MCTHSLRTMTKPLFLNLAGLFEAIFWSCMAVWIWAWWWKLDTHKIWIYEHAQRRNSDVEEEKLTNSEYKLTLQHWDGGLKIHVSLCCVFILISGFLFLGLYMKSRCLLIAWMLLNTMNAILRMVAMGIYFKAYLWLRWFELYWLVRIYLFVAATNYCLDLWDEVREAERVATPVLVPIDGDPRPWEQRLLYPERPVALEAIPAIYGRHRLLPYRVNPVDYPEFYYATDANHQTILVLDEPPTASL